jgi:tRNA A22 N-methylase
MYRIEEIKSAIEKLPKNEFMQLRKWLLEKDWQQWDEEILKDSEEGKLDFLIEEALEKKDREN